VSDTPVIRPVDDEAVHVGDAEAVFEAGFDDSRPVVRVGGDLGGESGVRVDADVRPRRSDRRYALDGRLRDAVDVREDVGDARFEVAGLAARDAQRDVDRCVDLGCRLSDIRSRRDSNAGATVRPRRAGSRESVSSPPRVPRAPVMPLASGRPAAVSAAVRPDRGGCPTVGRCRHPGGCHHGSAPWIRPSHRESNLASGGRPARFQLHHGTVRENGPGPVTSHIRRVQGCEKRERPGDRWTAPWPPVGDDVRVAGGPRPDVGYAARGREPAIAGVHQTIPAVTDSAARRGIQFPGVGCRPLRRKLRRAAVGDGTVMIISWNTSLQGSTGGNILNLFHDCERIPSFGAWSAAAEMTQPFGVRPRT